LRGRDRVRGHAATDDLLARGAVRRVGVGDLVDDRVRARDELVLARSGRARVSLRPGWNLAGLEVRGEQRAAEDVAGPDGIRGELLRPDGVALQLERADALLRGSAEESALPTDVVPSSTTTRADADSARARPDDMTTSFERCGVLTI
jgi:hypothetical protein